MSITMRQATDYKKILRHEHLDCSNRPFDILEIGVPLGIDLPADLRDAWLKAGNDLAAKQKVADAYQKWVSQFASESLDNYLKAIVDHVLPVMQTQEHLYLATKHRIEDAQDDNIIGMMLRFAPQLHRRNGLTIQQVIDPVQQACAEAPFPVRLVVCALRHENGRLAWHLANAVIRNPLVTTFDLAASETLFPGVLPWYAKQARRVALSGKEVEIHLGETQVITDADHEALDQIVKGTHQEERGVNLAHGAHGDSGDKQAQHCVTSNLVTKAVKDLASHPIDRNFRAGKKVTVDTDGTLFTSTTLSREYFIISQQFGWGPEEFFKCNMNALDGFPIDPCQLNDMERQIRKSYGF